MHVACLAASYPRHRLSAHGKPPCCRSQGTSTVTGNVSWSWTVPVRQKCFIADTVTHLWLHCSSSVRSWRSDRGLHRVFAPHSPMDLELGHRVRVMLSSGRISTGTIRFLGHLQGEAELHLGVELLTPDQGVQDGCYRGQSYFEWWLIKYTMCVCVRATWMSASFTIQAAVLLADPTHCGFFFNLMLRKSLKRILSLFLCNKKMFYCILTSLTNFKLDYQSVMGQHCQNGILLFLLTKQTNFEKFCSQHSTPKLSSGSAPPSASLCKAAAQVLGREPFCLRQWNYESRF